MGLEQVQRYGCISTKARNDRRSMKGIVIDCRIGKIKEVDDGLPQLQQDIPRELPITESLNFSEVNKRLAELDNLKARVEKLEMK